MGNGWHSFFLKARGGVGGGRERERETYTHRHTHASHSQGRGREQARQRGSKGREREIPKAALRLSAGVCQGAASMLVLSPLVWGSYLQLLFCFAFSQTAYVDNVFSVSAGKLL